MLDTASFMFFDWKELYKLKKKVSMPCSYIHKSAWLYGIETFDSFSHKS